MNHRPRTFGHAATWLCVATLVILSLVPGNERPRTGLEGQWEHFLAYAGTGLIATLAYYRPGWTIGGLCLLSSVLELLQNFVPGRGPAVMDAMFSTAGGIAGAGMAVLMTTVLDKSWPERRWRD